MTLKPLLASTALFLSACGSTPEIKDWSDLETMEAHIADIANCKWEDSSIDFLDARTCFPVNGSPDGYWASRASAAYLLDGNRQTDNERSMNQSKYRRGLWVIVNRFTTAELNDALEPFGFTPDMIAVVVNNTKDTEAAEIFEINNDGLTNLDHNDSRMAQQVLFDSNALTVRLRAYQG
jgi:hypothetical protein